tara:strand:+ start:1547 stop:2113 length:567 start_codon:yes stop_codon:yes gene_type:complete
MTLLQNYLSKKRVKKVLSLKPGQEGFSLIELVVVVAVLAVLSAIAIPQFTNISNKARTAAAMNTVATVAKECAAKVADQGAGSAGAVYNPPITIQGYNNSGGWYGASTGITTATLLGTKSTTPTAIPCPTSNYIGLYSDTPSEYPHFFYNVGTGEKLCAYTSGTNAATRGCTCTTVGTGTSATTSCSW